MKRLKVYFATFGGIWSGGPDGHAICVAEDDRQASELIAEEAKKHGLDLKEIELHSYDPKKVGVHSFYNGDY